MTVPFLIEPFGMSLYPMMGKPDYNSLSAEAFSYPEPHDNYSESFSHRNYDLAMEAHGQPPPTMHRPPNTTASNAPCSGWSTEEMCNTFALNDVPDSTASPVSLVPTPSGSSAACIPVRNPMSGSTSLRSLECAPPFSDSGQRASEGETTATPAPRKRGRPRRKRTSATSANSSLSSNSVRQTTCVPHTQVERKYREGINMQLERLRRAVPTLPQAVGADAIGVAKPSKGIVLAAAIDYISRIERERDAAIDEIERLAGDV